MAQKDLLSAALDECGLDLDTSDTVINPLNSIIMLKFYTF